MSREDLKKSLIGIKREIARRDQLLRHLRTWYRHPNNSFIGYSMQYFYSAGPKALREKTKLMSICEDLEKIIAMGLEKSME